MTKRLLEYEWDRKKAASNLRKHRVSFKEGATVFSDVFALTYDDPDHSQRERRYLTIGTSAQGRLLIVAHAARGERVRIINVRKVTKREREVYEEQNS